MTSTIRIEGADKVLAMLAVLKDPQYISAAVKAAAVHVKGKVAQYPAQRHITVKEAGGWASEKQRRFVMAAIREGRITVPYKRGSGDGRSETLGRRWTIEMRNRGLTAVIGNNASYAPFVQGEGTQSRMHNIIGWKTTDTIAEQEKERVIRFINEAVAKVIKVGK